MTTGLPSSAEDHTTVADAACWHLQHHFSSSSPLSVHHVVRVAFACRTASWHLCVDYSAHLLRLSRLHTRFIRHLTRLLSVLLLKAAYTSAASPSQYSLTPEYTAGHTAAKGEGCGQQQQLSTTLLRQCSKVALLQGGNSVGQTKAGSSFCGSTTVPLDNVACHLPINFKYLCNLEAPLHCLMILCLLV
jgi:hypothetical protein